MSNFNIRITNLLHSEKTIAEIWHEDELFASIRQEYENLQIMLYPSSKIATNFDEFVNVLESAKKQLLKEK